MPKRTILITGGAGFIGCNVVRAFYRQGDHIVVVDDLSRPGSSSNLTWLQKNCQFDFHQVDISQFHDVEQAFGAHPEIDAIVHLAAQTAVTTSIVNPRRDFEINALGTFNILEAAKRLRNAPAILYASTNKVYGKLDQLTIVEEDTRYRLQDFPMGIQETQEIDFYSPYGCSKGAAEQYVHDYARIYGLPTVIFRQSCIYGYRQLGIEDQGWVTWLILAALCNMKIVIYGDGKQVRDILFIDDLVKAYVDALNNIESTSGQIYNIGGGPTRSISIWQEFQPWLERQIGDPVDVETRAWRAGDQKVFVTDISKAKRDFAWEPTISVEEGLECQYRWIQKNLELFRKAGIINLKQLSSCNL